MKWLRYWISYLVGTKKEVVRTQRIPRKSYNEYSMECGYYHF